MADFELKILGDPALWGPAGRVAGRAAHKRRLALLAVLGVARGRPVGRERLLGLLWADLPAEAARHNLSESLYVLRKELGEGALVVGGADLALDPQRVASDVDAFETALDAGDDERAVEAYGGPLLDGFYVEGAPEFERWADRERDRLWRACAAAIEALAERAEEEGSAVRAVGWWRRLATHDPLSSRVALRLARALDEAGERPSALRVAESHTALVRQELGVRPDPVLEAFVARVRAEAVQPAPAAARAEASPPAPVASAASAESTGEAGQPSGAIVPQSRGEVDEESVDSPSIRRVGVGVGDEAGAGRDQRRASMDDASARTIDRATRRGTRRLRARLAAYAGAAGVVGLGLGLLAAGERRRAEPAAPRYDPRRIAVLYFDDESPRAEMQYLANGLTEMLIHELSQVPALDVVSRGGVKPYRDRVVRFDTLAADLRAGSVVEGTVQRSGDSVFVTVDLVDASTGAHLESRMVSRRLGDVVALERAVADEVAASLRRRLGREVRLTQVRGETEVPAAADLVLRAEDLRADAARLGQSRDPQDVLSATRLLRRADSLLAAAERADRAWARPTVLRGWVDLALGAHADDGAHALLLASAVARAERVLAREPGNAAALELRGTAQFGMGARAAPGSPDAGRLDAAEHDLRAAVAADSTAASAWSALSLLLRLRGRFAESDLTARRALAADAYLDDAPAIRQRLAFSAMSAGDYAAARDECARGAAQFPADWRFVECRLTLLRQDTAAPPDPALAWRLVARLDRLDPPEKARAEGRAYSPLFRRMVAAAVSARAGQGDTARAVLARARAQAAELPELRLSLDYDEAYVRLVLGERDSARARLAHLAAARPYMRAYLARDPLVSPAAPAVRQAARPR